MQLTPIETIHEQLQGSLQRFRAARKTARATRQTSQIMAQLKVTLKPIVDKATAQPLSTNAITCTWYSGQGDVIKTEKYQDRDSLELSVVGDGETRLEVLVEALGYSAWTLGFRTKLNKNKVIVTPVEMVK
jgi:hypothetical protein